MNDLPKPDCYKCPHRGTFAGSAHSSCNHPALASFKDAHPTMRLLEFWPGPPLPLTAKVNGEEVPITMFNETGIRNGWASWPFNFDPTWLDFCLFWAAEHQEKPVVATP